MSKSTTIDEEREEAKVTEPTLEERVNYLEQQGRAVLLCQKNMLENFRGLIEAITEQREVDELGEEIFENVINLSSLPSEE
tara:strand:+ start:730 stop:972 length:243 start_codon:yes stop_codon:yes gene_type:complete